MWEKSLQLVVTDNHNGPIAPIPIARWPIAFPLTPADTEPPPHPDTAPVGARQSENCGLI
ncbi:MAG: hypothetical protein GDA43_24340 [Hormoscilla sp. SP5CHS1]|nr:hypothetical protein [Hormoscilla sp. SP12CHS1]MBC6455925.1 hypothetical protein [Hormoscilla sp. SP5CHS1]